MWSPPPTCEVSEASLLRLSSAGKKSVLTRYCSLLFERESQCFCCFWGRSKQLWEGGMCSGRAAAGGVLFFHHFILSPLAVSFLQITSHVRFFSSDRTYCCPCNNISWRPWGKWLGRKLGHRSCLPPGPLLSKLSPSCGPWHTKALKHVYMLPLFQSTSCP